MFGLESQAVGHRVQRKEGGSPEEKRVVVITDLRHLNCRVEPKVAMTLGGSREETMKIYSFLCGCYSQSLHVHGEIVPAAEL
jgi:hypothetical protein